MFLVTIVLFSFSLIFRWPEQTCYESLVAFADKGISTKAISMAFRAYCCRLESTSAKETTGEWPASSVHPVLQKPDNTEMLSEALQKVAGITLGIFDAIQWEVGSGMKVLIHSSPISGNCAYF